MIKFFKTGAAPAVAVFTVLLMFAGCRESQVASFKEAGKTARIDPDYAGVTIPPNIAPLNFRVLEPGSAYRVEIRAKAGRFTVHSTSGKIKIPAGQWRRLLSGHRGGSLWFDIYVRDGQNQWTKFQTIKNNIAAEKIDPFVVYRLIHPGYVLWWEMGIYQRNIENFSQSAVFTNRITKRNCMNCHAFCRNNPDKMLFHMRAGYSGTLFADGGRVRKVDTATDYTMSAGVYPAWHPDGKHVAFSVNIIHQFFHAHRDKTILVKDKASDLVIYNIETNTVTTSPKVSTERLENLPVWSADGRYLYFCSAPGPKRQTGYDDIKYDLHRIAYDTHTNQWGEVESVLTAREAGRSISFPKISPDGRYLMFCGSDYGYFTIHFKSGDLFLLELSSGRFRKMEINSDHVESYHSWSSNSRWFVFSSKKRDGLCARLYFGYVDDKGRAGKPVLLPQKDPDFYDTFVKNYNVPELVHGPVTIGHRELARAAFRGSEPVSFDKTVDVDGLSGATRIVRK